MTGICCKSRPANRRACWLRRRCSTEATSRPAYQRFIGTACSVNPSHLKNCTNQNGAGMAEPTPIDQHLRLHYFTSPRSLTPTSMPSPAAAD